MKIKNFNNYRKLRGSGKCPDKSVECVESTRDKLNEWHGLIQDRDAFIRRKIAEYSEKLSDLIGFLEGLCSSRTLIITGARDLFQLDEDSIRRIEEFFESIEQLVVLLRIMVREGRMVVDRTFWDDLEMLAREPGRVENQMILAGIINIIEIGRQNLPRGGKRKKNRTKNKVKKTRTTRKKNRT